MEIKQIFKNNSLRSHNLKLYLWAISIKIALFGLPPSNRLHLFGVEVKTTIHKMQFN